MTSNEFKSECYQRKYNIIKKNRILKKNENLKKKAFQNTVAISKLILSIQVL